MGVIHTVRETINNPFPECFKGVGDFLDKHKTWDKVALIASHFFRALPMFAMMMLPCSLLVRAGLMIGGTLVYYAASEYRFCGRRFAILSLLGGGAAWIGRSAVVNFISGAAFASVEQFLKSTLWIAPLAGYVIWVIYTSHYEVEARACH